MQSVPKVFVASSGEAVRLAQAIEQNLKIAEVRLWSTPDVLYPGSNLIDELNRILKHSDFGVFIFSGDDEVKIKGQRQQAVRDAHAIGKHPRLVRFRTREGWSATTRRV